jgi:hypothetical protein
MIALFLLLVIAAIALGIVGVMVKGLLRCQRGEVPTGASASAE